MAQLFSIIDAYKLLMGKKALIITDTAEYLHRYLTQPQITAEDRMTRAIQFLTAALKDVPERIFNSQLEAIDAVIINAFVFPSIACMHL